MKEEKIEYTVVRSARRTLSVTVRDGAVAVRAPYGMTDERIASFIESQRQWVLRQLARCARVSETFKAVREGRSILLFGKEKALVLGGAKNGETEETIVLKSLSAAKPYYMKTRAFLLVEKTAVLSVATGLHAEDVTVRDFKSRWGCCGADKKIRLNWRLLMLPVSLQEYVIVHELCHLVHIDHSALFWKEVEKFIPDYKTRRKQLKDYAFLTLMYR